MARNVMCLVLYRDDMDEQHQGVHINSVNNDCFPRFCEKIHEADVVMFVNSRGEDKRTVLLKNRLGMFGNVLPLRKKQNNAKDHSIP
jgi:hypothetical protein